MLIFLQMANASVLQDNHADEQLHSKEHMAC